jgi:hypothetical protein
MQLSVANTHQQIVQNVAKIKKEKRCISPIPLPPPPAMTALQIFSILGYEDIQV